MKVPVFDLERTTAITCTPVNCPGLRHQNFLHVAMATFRAYVSRSRLTAKGSTRKYRFGPQLTFDRCLGML